MQKPPTQPSEPSSEQPDPIERRSKLNALAFLDHIAGAGGYSLRSASYLTWETMAVLEMYFLKGSAVFKTLPPRQQLDEIHAYLFIQAAPLPRVSRAVRAFERQRAQMDREEAWETFICDVVEPFLAELAPEVKAELADQLAGLEEIEAARVHAEPPPGGKRERPHPNS